MKSQMRNTGSDLGGPMAGTPVPVECSVPSFPYMDLFTNGKAL